MQGVECLTLFTIIFVHGCLLNYNRKGLQNYDMMSVHVHVQSFQLIQSLQHVHLFNVLF